MVLARDADPWADPALVLRAATAAARAGLPLAPHALDRLATESAPLPAPWPPAARDAFVDLLGTGHAAVPVLEALDQAGLLVRLLPEWARVRSRPQRNPVHRFTVDRHLTEAAAQAAALTRTVARPDLLLLGALLHDIGKGWPGDHTDAGVAAVRELGPRLGLSYGDAATVVAMVRHHLLLPDTATRRDLDDPVTVRGVVDAVAGSADLLDLLHALSIADGLATGPAAWSEWKAGLVAELVGRARDAMSGAPPPAPPVLTACPARPGGGRGDRRRRRGPGGRRDRHRGRAGLAGPAQPDDGRARAAPAGRPCRHRDDRRAAPRSTSSPSPRASGAGRSRRCCAPTSPGRWPARCRSATGWPRPSGAYGPGQAAAAPPRVLWFDGAATGATVLELRAADAAGLLHRVTAALERRGLDVRGARVSTLGGAVVDAFYVVGPDGRPVTDAALRDRVTDDLLAAAALSPPSGRSA